MDRSSVLLALAIILLTGVYASFLTKPYLILNQIILSNVFGFIAAILLYLAYVQRGKEIRIKQNVNIYLIIGIVLFFILIILQYIGSAVILSVSGIIAFGYFSRKLNSHQLYAFIIAGIIITAAVSYIYLIQLWGYPWRGVDEITYGYYAAFFVLHGKNPYTMNMASSLLQYHTNPSIQLNGTVEGAYNYPAVSLIVPIILSVLDQYAYVIMLFVVSLVTVAVSLLLYRKSKYNIAILIPITAWVFATYLMVPTINQYLAVSVFLVLAYILRKKTIIYGILLGLAASTIQLAWFALPFFFILTLREEGKKKFYESIFIALAVFLIINGLFIIAAPKAFLNGVFGVFLTSKLLPVGPNIMELFMRVYPVALWVPAAITVIAFAVLLILFYFYTATLKPLIAIAPAFIFFLSWRNLEYYGLAFVPFIILLCYMKEKNPPKDLIKNRKPIAYALFTVVIISLLLAVYGHFSYAKQNTLVITYMHPIIQNSSGTYNMNQLILNITNNGNHAENVTFLYFTDTPNAGNFILSPTLSGLSAHSYKNYTLNASIINVSNRSNLYVMAFSKDYITWYRTKIKLNNS